MNYNDGTTLNYRNGDELVRSHTTAAGATREDRFLVSHIGNYYGNAAVFGKKWMKKKDEWSKGNVFIEYFHADKGDFFTA